MSIIVSLKFSEDSYQDIPKSQAGDSSHVQELYQGEEITIGSSMSDDFYIPASSFYLLNEKKHCVLRNIQDKLYLLFRSGQKIYHQNQVVQGDFFVAEQAKTQFTFADLTTLEISYEVKEVNYSSLQAEERKNLLCGKQLGNYVVSDEKPVIAGHSSYVFYGKHKSLGTPVAIKILKGDANVDKKTSVKALKNARLISKMSHPGLPTLHHADVKLLDLQGKHWKAFYYVFSWIEGRTLADELEDGRIFDVDEAIDLILDIASPLEYLHKRNIIHRNVAPEHIMVIPNDDGGLDIKLLGISLLKDLENETQYTLTGAKDFSLVGCSSPEVLDSGRSEEINSSSDIFSLAAIFYHLLAGRYPFQENTDYFRPVVPPREYNPNIPEEINAIIIQALDYDPEKRFPSVQDITRKLRQFRENKVDIFGTPNFIETPETYFLSKPYHGEMGGDFFDFILSQDQKKLVILVGDITGHGINAGLIAGMTKITIRMLKSIITQHNIYSPQDILRELNNFLTKLFPKEMFADIFCATVHLHEGIIEFCQAGGIMALLYKNEKATYQPLNTDGFWLGRENFTGKNRKVSFKKNDLFCIVTDGISEAGAYVEPHESYGERALLRKIFECSGKSCRDLAYIIYEDVCNKQQPHDDATIMFMRL